MRRMLAPLLAFLAILCLPTLASAQQYQPAFKPQGGATLSVTVASARVALPTAGPTALIINTGANTAYIKFGNASVTAATTDYLLGPGCSAAYDVNGQADVAAITGSSTTTLSVITGAGIPPLPPSACGITAGSTTANQGTPAAVANAWPVKVTDGTNTAAVKAASTAPSASDPALVVAISPNGVNANGQATMAGSAPVVIASDQSAVPVAGAAASGASVSGNPLGNGCRAATAAPTAVTDGQAVFTMCGAEGKQVTLPYAIKELAVRGSASGTDNAAHSIIASAGGSLKNYITALQCSNISATTTIVTMSDSASSVFIVPANGGTNIIFPVPLVTAAATAFSFTATTGVTTMYCSAQGYTGL